MVFKSHLHQNPLECWLKNRLLGRLKSFWSKTKELAHITRWGDADAACSCPTVGTSGAGKPHCGQVSKGDPGWRWACDFLTTSNCSIQFLVNGTQELWPMWRPNLVSPRSWQKVLDQRILCLHQHLLPCLWSQHHHSSYPHDLSALPYFWHLGHCVSKALLLTAKSLSLGCTPPYQNLTRSSFISTWLGVPGAGGVSVFQPCPIASFHSVMCVENIHWPVARPFCSICFLMQQPKKLIISASNVHIPNGSLTRSFLVHLQNRADEHT